MAEVVTLPDGRNETVFDERGFLELVEEYMGGWARRWLEEREEEKSDDAAYAEELEKELAVKEAKYKDVMKRLRSLSERLSSIIREPEPDREAISRIAGEIGEITWKGVNG